MERLNYFNPFENRSPHHEDRLTRALLSTMRLSPAAFGAFYGLVHQKFASKGLPYLHELDSELVEIDTQRASLPEGMNYFSILITDDSFEDRIAVDATDRRAVYDGIIKISEAAVFTIEVKPSNRNVWTQQLSPNRKDIPDEATVHKEAVDIPMRDIISLFQRVSESNNSTFSERQLINDLFHYVNTHYSSLNPFDKFTLCTTGQLANRRIELLLQQIASDEATVRHHQGWGHTIQIPNIPGTKMVGLLLDETEQDWSGVTLAFDFGSTVSQARAFYGNPSVQLDDLQRIDGVEVAGNLHLAKLSSNVLWFEPVEGSVEAYFNHWSDTSNIRQIRRDEFQTFKDELVELGVIRDSPQFEAKIMYAGYNTLNVCPGLYCTYSLSRAEAERLDAEGQLEKTIAGKIVEILSVLDPETERIRALLKDRYVSH